MACFIGGLLLVFVVLAVLCLFSFVCNVGGIADLFIAFAIVLIVALIITLLIGLLIAFPFILRVFSLIVFAGSGVVVLWRGRGIIALLDVYHICIGFALVVGCRCLVILCWRGLGRLEEVLHVLSPVVVCSEVSGVVSL